MQQKNWKARIQLSGHSRRDIARRLYLSYSAFNKKLRDNALTKAEEAALAALLSEERA